ncbi:MAG TPA: neutral zinc metallopeptidase [Vineibacter sp.]|nr:neutral zinc metallopeptidase [Vineibacter sp.]
MRTHSSVKLGFAASVFAVSLAAATAPANAYSVADAQRMGHAGVAPHEVASVMATVPRVASYLNAAWTAATQQAGVAYEPPRLVAYTQAFRHPVCGQVGVNNAGYCHGSNEVVYDPIYLAALAKRVGSGNLGDGWYAIVVVIAHEWGHAIVDQTQRATRSRRAHEAAADCLAGAVTRYALDGGTIGHREVNTAYRVLSALGDGPGGGVHGAGPVRQLAFQYGFDNGAARCLAATASR